MGSCPDTDIDPKKHVEEYGEYGYQTNKQTGLSVISI